MTDIPRQQGRKGPAGYSSNVDDLTRSRTQGSEAQMGGRKPASSNADNGYRFDRLFSAGENGSEDMPYSAAPATDREVTRFQDRLRKGKVRVCRACGGVMNKSSRMILSAAAGILLMGLGAGLMVLYGLAKNFFQTPWYVQYALPASYYVGSLFVGVGILFFFIRERIWYCPECKGIDKR